MKKTILVIFGLIILVSLHIYINISILNSDISCILLTPLWISIYSSYLIISINHLKKNGR